MMAGCFLLHSELYYSGLITVLVYQTEKGDAAKTSFAAPPKQG